MFNFTRAKKYAAKGNIKKAEACFDKMAKGNANLSKLVTYGYFLAKAGKGEKSKLLFEEKIIPKFNKLQKQIPQAEITVMNNYSISLWKSGNLDKAIKVSEELLGKYKNTQVYGSLGLYYILAGNKKAYSFCLEAYDFAPDDMTIIDNLAYCCFKEKFYDKAKEYYKLLVSKKPNYPDAYHFYGVLLMKTGEKEEAKKMFKKAISLDYSALSVATKEETEKLLKA